MLHAIEERRDRVQIRVASVPRALVVKPVRLPNDILITHLSILQCVDTNYLKAQNKREKRNTTTLLITFLTLQNWVNHSLTLQHYSFDRFDIVL